MFFESCLGFCGAAGFSPMQQCLHLEFKRRVLGMDRPAPSVCFFFRLRDMLFRDSIGVNYIGIMHRPWKLLFRVACRVFLRLTTIPPRSFLSTKLI